MPIRAHSIAVSMPSGAPVSRSRCSVACAAALVAERADAVDDLEMKLGERVMALGFPDHAFPGLSG